MIDRQFKALALVASVVLPAESDALHASSLSGERLRGARFALRKPSLGSLVIHLRRRLQERVQFRLDQHCIEKSNRGEKPRMRGDHNARDAELFGQRARVQWTAAAERNQRKVAGIEPALDGDDTQNFRHRVVDECDDSERHRLGAESRRLCDSLDRRPSARGVDRKGTPEQCAGIEPPEHDVRIGNRRAIGASVARRSRVGARRKRADVQRAGGIAPRDRSSACAYLREIDEGKSNRIPAALHGAPAVRCAGGFKLPGHLHDAVDDGARFRGRTAHVEREQTGGADPFSQRGGCDHAAGRPALDDRRGQRRNALRRCHPAVAAHDEERRANAPTAQVLGKPFQIRLDDRREHRVDDRRREAFVLTVLRIDLRGAHDAHAREVPRDGIGEQTLVRVVCVGVQKADCHRRDVAGSQLRANALDLRARRARAES